MAFPFFNGLFIRGGLGQRQLKLSGSAQSPVYICPITEPTPCSDADNRIETASELQLKASYSSLASYGKLDLGWALLKKKYGYFLIHLGAEKPFKVSSSTKVTANILAPSEDVNIEGALAELKAAKEEEFSTKAYAAIQPYEKKLLPVLGISLGIAF